MPSLIMHSFVYLNIEKSPIRLNEQWKRKTSFKFPRHNWYSLLCKICRKPRAKELELIHKCIQHFQSKSHLINWFLGFTFQQFRGIQIPLCLCFLGINYLITLLIGTWTMRALEIFCKSKIKRDGFRKIGDFDQLKAKIWNRGPKYMDILSNSSSSICWKILSNGFKYINISSAS